MNDLFVIMKRQIADLSVLSCVNGKGNSASIHPNLTQDVEITSKSCICISIEKTCEYWINIFVSGCRIRIGSAAYLCFVCRPCCTSRVVTLT